MFYDPVKDIFASVIRKHPKLRILFYKILDLMFLRSWYVRRELKHLRNIFRDKSIEIYDAGTGYGQYVYFMSKHLRPGNIYAVDVKEEWINDCRAFFKSENINNVSFGVEDLTNIEYESKFDIIVCVDVMEHIEDDVKVFQNFYRAMKRGSYLLINTPSIYGGSDVHNETGESFIGEHARTGYSREDLEAKLLPIGFSVYRWKYTYGFWGDKAWRLGIKYPITLVNISRFFMILLPLYFLVTLPFTLIMMYIDYAFKNKIGSGITLIVKK